MPVLLFELILVIVIIFAIIVIFGYFEWSSELGVGIAVFLCIMSFIVPSELFNEYAIESNTERHSYDLIQSEYVQPSSGKYSSILVSYCDEDGYIKKYNVTNSKIVYYDGTPKIEFVKAKWGFLTNTRAIVYVNQN